MADTLRLNRISKFYGGITTGDRDKKEGVCLNIEEIDIFSNPAWIQPETIFTADSVITRAVSGYTKDNGDNLYALGRTTDPFFQVWKKTTASANSPGAWASFYSSPSVAPCTIAPIIWHKWDDASDWLYVVTGADNATTRTVYRIGDLPATTTVSSTDSGATTMTLDGLAGSFDRIPAIKVAGELFWGHGQYISKVDSTGVFTSHAFTLPNGWICVSFAAVGDEMAILAKSQETGENTAKVFFWDITATTGINDEVTVPMGGPQIIVNHNEVLRVCAAKNGILRVYQLQGKVPIKTHQLDNIAAETDTQPIIPDTSKFTKDNVVYFALWKTDKSGLYALGQNEEGRPLALILSRRFHTSDYSLHKPLAATATGPNLFVAFDDNGTKSNSKLEGNNSPTRSSNATYESIWIDSDSPETFKEWPGFFVISKIIPSGCTITVDARVDNAASYDSSSSKALTSSNDQNQDGGTADTFWYRDWESVLGRALQVRIRFTSSGTSNATLYMTSFLSRETNIL